jgi:hypothetical protein|nr:MAG TPA: hypothetical protein [Caudoviricetes sp.]DAR37355.1 MAG TPA: hypothetical protein [Caudoviricetes sp.]DAT93198.1 MAG TPA: hypothetical protein [Caudoviricetes sp.]
MNTNIETALMSLIGSDPRFQRAMAMMQGKTPAERQQIVMNMISTQGIPQTQLAPLIADIKQKFAMFGIQL